jgi:ESF2/ABP1 family protein
MSISSSKRSPTREKYIEECKGDEIEDQDGEENDDIEGSEHDDPLAEPSALSAEALARYREAQECAGVIYISRIPPGMSPTKVRHLMSAYGEVGRVYLQQEGMYPIIGSDSIYYMDILPGRHALRPPFPDPKSAYLRKKFTTTKKPHFTEGWVEFKDKRIARSVATMLNAQPIGGKKGSRWRDDVWTMKYLPRFKWYMLTEQVGMYLFEIFKSWF